jgi:hypothetical protein
MILRDLKETLLAMQCLYTRIYTSNQQRRILLLRIYEKAD